MGDHSDKLCREDTWGINKSKYNIQIESHEKAEVPLTQVFIMYGMILVDLYIAFIYHL
ncbi:hypothetical protein D3C75_1360260 [compost metagenome]